LARVHALHGNEVLCVFTVAVLVSELNAGKRGTTSRIVKNVLHNTLDIAAEKKEKKVSTQLF
jgi:hypothetical protein